jgi:hypothetical protein
MPIRTIFRWGFTILLGLPLLICVVKGYFPLQAVTKYAVQIMFGYLFIGMMMLIAKKTHWMWICLGYCMMLCLFLRSGATEGIRYPSPLLGEASYKIGQFDMSSINEHLDSALNNIRVNNLDVLCFQAVSLNQDTLLRQSLKSQYKYAFSINRVDLYSMLLLSKYPFIQADTFNIANTPNIEAHIEFDDKHILRILASYIKPPFSGKALEEQQAYLKNLSQISKKETARTISLGNFNCVPWSNEISDFKTNSRLSDSRLGLMLSYPSDLKTMMRVPLEYIFYSKDIRCTNFHAFNSAQNEYLGVVGIYQLCPLK